MRIGAAKFNLKLNIPKCVAFVFGGSDDDHINISAQILNEFPDKNILSAKNFSVLGAAVTDYAVRAAIEEKVRMLRRMTSRLPLLPNHQAFFLLKDCLAVL